MSSQTLLLYLMTWSLVALSPGPAVMCSMAQAARYGFRSSLTGISGIQFGNLLFFIAIACGLGTLLAAATTAFTILRIAGAIYLLYLGLRIIFSTFHRSPQKTAPAKTPPPPRHGLFLQGLLVQITNPKALLFVSALLPQFIDPHRPLLLQLAILLLATVIVDLIVLSAYAFMAHRSLRSFRASRASTWLERALGAALLFFGFRLLTSRKP